MDTLQLLFYENIFNSIDITLEKTNTSTILEEKEEKEEEEPIPRSKEKLNINVFPVTVNGINYFVEPRTSFVYLADSQSITPHFWNCNTNRIDFIDNPDSMTDSQTELLYDYYCY